MQQSFIHTPDGDSIIQSDAPLPEARIPTMAPSPRHVDGDKIVEIKALPGPDGELLLSFLHASGKHRLQPVRSLEVLIRQLADQTATPRRQAHKFRDFAVFSKKALRLRRQNTD